jgi:hypothetical protein
LEAGEWHSSAIGDFSRMRAERPVPSPAFRWPAVREDKNLSALRHIEALRERRLHVL